MGRDAHKLLNITHLLSGEYRFDLQEEALQTLPHSDLSKHVDKDA
jgi:hypothetical protein